MANPESDSLSRQIQELQDELEVLKKDHQQLLSFVSHDVKGPFNRIFALFHLFQLEDNAPTKNQKDYLDKIFIVISDSLSMIQNLTDYRNMNYRKVELVPAPLQVKPFLTKIINQFRPLAEKKKISLEAQVEIQAELHTDAYAVTRIFSNVVSNAVKFSPLESSISIGVTGSATEIVIRVTDAAPGFKPEEKERIFREKFVRLSNQATAGENTTGLGLFVAGQFAEKIGASISCASNRGRGSTFTITLPRQALQSNK